jgi:hypothetical protein
MTMGIWSRKRVRRRHDGRSDVGELGAFVAIGMLG